MVLVFLRHIAVERCDGGVFDRSQSMWDLKSFDGAYRGRNANVSVVAHGYPMADDAIEGEAFFSIL